MRMYLAGPMTGIPERNYPAFADAAAALRRAGYTVSSPHDIDLLHNTANEAQVWEWYMRHAIRMLLRADAVAMLPGWQASRGAKIEHRIARDLRMDVRTYAEWLQAAVPPQ